MNLVAVYTQPDRPSGRGRRLSPGPVKQVAVEHGVPVIQPETFRDDAAYREFKAFAPDIMVVAAFGQILPARILDVPVHGCVNVHASLLPRWRGAAPVARAIEAGDETSGVSIMQMDVGMDTGAVIVKCKISVDRDDSAGTLMEKLADLGSGVLADCLDDYISGKLVPVPQDETLATYAPKLTKAEALIDWSMDASAIRNKIRALNPWPVAHTYHRGNRIRVIEAEIIGQAESGPRLEQGCIEAVERNGIVVECGYGMLRLTMLQKDHGRPLAARDFLNGYSVAPGDRLESPLR